jgi:hypothetical protein
MLDACRSGDLRQATSALKMGLKPNGALNVRGMLWRMRP